jgi:hypothetical protein
MQIELGADYTGDTKYYKGVLDNISLTMLLVGL